MMIPVPPAIRVAALDWELERFDKRFDALAGQFQTERVPAARWRCSVTLPPMKPEMAGACEAFLARASDLGNSFKLGRDDRPLMGAGGSGVVYGANQTGRSIMTDGWGSGGLILRAGDMIQLGPNRLHIVTADVYASPGGILYDEEGNPALTEGNPPQIILVEGEGRASIPIEPALQSSPEDGEQILLGVDAKAVFSLDSGYSVTSVPGIISGITFSAVQDLAWSP
jgi:hypothetical protein